MLDDGINVHGAYVKVVAYLGNKEFLCEISHFQQWGLIFAEAGDELALISRETILPFFETTVARTKVLNERRLVVTVSDMPEQLPEGPLSMENLTWYPDVVMKKNIIRENRARGALITTKGKVVAEFPAIDLQYCDAVTIQDNAATGFDHPLAITLSSDVTNAKTVGNEGFKLR